MGSQGKAGTSWLLGILCFWPTDRSSRSPDYIRRRKAVKEEEGTAPLFCSLTLLNNTKHLTGTSMITTQELTEALERQLAGTPHFVVHAEVRPGGKAIVEVDNDQAITLSVLTDINQGLREAFGEKLDDVELEVGSPGMGNPFRVMRQYRKHIGRVVEVLKKDGTVVLGQLTSADGESLSLLVQHPSKVLGRLPKLDSDPTAIPFAEIKSTKATHKFN